VIGRHFLTRGSWAACAVLLTGCWTADWRGSDLITDLVVTPDPSGYAPLTAEVELTLSRPARIEVVVSGRGRTEADVRHRFGEMTRHAEIPVLGLYPGTSNAVTLRLLDEDDALLDQTTFRIRTARPHGALPDITVEVANEAEMAPGMTLVSYFGQDEEPGPQLPFMFDMYGAIRWYLDFTGHPTLGDLRYDNGPERLANGNLYFGVRETGRIVEVDMLGRVVNTWETPGYTFHHQVLEKPNGNFLVTVDEKGSQTIEDIVIEIDRESGEIVRKWDLKQSMVYGRRTWPTTRRDPNEDWFHANGLAYDSSDGTIIVSGRTQGVVKLTEDNEVVWILAPHLEWGTAGDGTNLSTKLLQPLDSLGRPITDPEVLAGRKNLPDFEWAWYQHAPELLPDGSLLLFDNGDLRNYSREVVYSRAVVYEIDPEAMTVRQLWQFGRERGSAAYSEIVSDVDYLGARDNVLFAPGAVGPIEDAYGKVIEVDRATGDPVFEATITPPVAPFGIVLHRAERLSLHAAEPRDASPQP
jgi:arylsulfate sulfotransferase